MAANGNGGGGSGGGLTQGHIEGIVKAMGAQLKLQANIINVDSDDHIKRYLASEDGHEQVAVINRRNGTTG